MNILCVIPSRLASTRLPRKALLPIQGVPMVERVYRQASSCSLLTKVVVATDSEEIAQVVASAGGEAIMTDPNLATGSDRVAAVARLFPEMEVVINLQGDEPFVRPEMLERLVAPYLAGENPDMSTLAFKISEADFPRPEVVKVIVDRDNYALYFSRSMIPYLRSKEATLAQLPVYHHMGMYAFRAAFLQQYCSLAQGDLEKAESLEQLRALENGHRIKVCLVSGGTLEINTEEDYQRAQHFNNG